MLPTAPATFRRTSECPRRSRIVSPAWAYVFSKAWTYPLANFLAKSGSLSSMGSFCGVTMTAKFGLIPPWSGGPTRKAAGFWELGQCANRSADATAQPSGYLSEKPLGEVSSPPLKGLMSTRRLLTTAANEGTTLAHCDFKAMQPTLYVSVLPGTKTSQTRGLIGPRYGTLQRDGYRFDFADFHLRGLDGPHLASRALQSALHLGHQLLDELIVQRHGHRHHGDTNVRGEYLLLRRTDGCRRGRRAGRSSSFWRPAPPTLPASPPSNRPDTSA